MVTDDARRLLDDLIAIPAGTVVIGSTEEIIDREMSAPDIGVVQRGWLLKELPRHEARVAAFRIGRVPITAGQVADLAPGSGGGASDPIGRDHPATLGVEGTLDFLRSLSELVGELVRLPTEEEWMRAARGDDARTYPWGDRWEEGRANIAGSSLGATAPVGSFPSGASAFGLLDMVGNADELTGSLYAPFPGAPPEVPAVESWALSRHLTKGGGWMHARDLARCDRRHGIYEPGEPLQFRVVVPGP